MEKTANPAPLGLMAFGMTTVLLNIHNAGFYPISAMILAMGLFYGGLAQVIVGIMEFKKGNTFGVTAFTSYGIFWMTLVAILVVPKTHLVDATPQGYMGWYLAMWGIFSAFMFVGTLRSSRALQFVFGSLVVLFGLLAARDLANLPKLGVVAGWEGIVCGASAIYLAMAEVLEEQFGRPVLPMGKPAPVVTPLAAVVPVSARVVELPTKRASVRP